MGILSLRLFAVVCLGWIAAGSGVAQDVALPDDPPATKKVASAPLVAPDKMIPFLPEPPEGWGAEKATGSMTDTDEIRMSSVRRSYFQKGEGDDLPSAVVTIIDSATNGDIFEGSDKDWPMASENEEGYDKRIVIDGMRALEHYSKPAKTGSLSVFVGGHYFVQIELTNGDPSALRDWLKRIDVKKLAALR